MRLIVKRSLFLFAAIVIAFTMNIHPVSAQAGTASDLINGVNALRQSQGLEPYTVDSFLMSYAQAHSDYMASLGTWTHVRADGTTAFDHGIKENVAMGTNMSIDYCIYTVWADYSHWVTMVGYTGGTVGAGVTISDDSTVYYTLNVIPSGGSYDDDIGDDDDSTGGQTAEETSIPVNPVITSTPDKDGIIIHTVKYGDTLWGIAEAYGVTIAQILTNSGLSSDTTAVFEGQTLIIQTATEPSATPSPTQTQNPGTPTPTQVRPTLTPYPTSTPSPTRTPTQPPSLAHRVLGDSKNVGISLIVLCGLGMIVVLYLGFLKKS
jgi:uncharacterized protein YkwD